MNIQILVCASYGSTIYWEMLYIAASLESSAPCALTCEVWRSCCSPSCTAGLLWQKQCMHPSWQWLPHALGRLQHQSRPTGQHGLLRCHHGTCKDSHHWCWCGHQRPTHLPAALESRRNGKDMIAVLLFLLPGIVGCSSKFEMISKL